MHGSYTTENTRIQTDHYVSWLQLLTTSRQKYRKCRKKIIAAID